MQVQGRYELREVIGKGGMGVVYRAWDGVIRRDVALKTLRDAPSREALELFRKECAVLAQISHPNIIEIFDLGELDQGDGPKPYLVMPLLSGQTLDWIIRHQSARLTPDRVTDMIGQTCRGLQAAHEKGLIHRDLKPSNLFILGDDSVKIIDFGVAHMADTRSTIGHKGTLLYMSPEQLEMKPLSPVSDVFSLAAICHEALTGKRPFDRGTQGETVRAILSLSPPPVSELNPAVSPIVSRVIHKAMAKQPRHRFPSAREFAEALQKAMRGEALEFMDPARMMPRVERAARAYQQGDLAFANEILGELEAEGFQSTDVTGLRRDLDATIRGQRLEQLLRSARKRFEEQEYSLALEKLAEIVQIDPENTEALDLRARIEKLRAAQKAEGLLEKAAQALAARAYAQAREPLSRILEIVPGEPRAAAMLADADRREREDDRIRNERYTLFQEAIGFCRAGELTEGETRLRRVVELDAELPDDDPEGRQQREAYLLQIRAEHALVEAACAEAENRLAAGDFGSALAISNEFLARYPGSARFRTIQAAVLERGPRALSGHIGEIVRQIEQQPDLDRKITLVEEAARLYPGESYLARTLDLLRQKRRQVHDVLSKAQLLEEMDQFQDALQQWESLRSIDPAMAGLESRIERARGLVVEQQRERLRAQWVERIQAKLTAAEWRDALVAVEQALAAFPDDSAVRALEAKARESLERSEKAAKLAAEGRDLCVAGLPEPGLVRLREAWRLDNRNAEVRAALLENLVEHSSELLARDWRTAEVLAREAVALDPASPAARGALELALDRSTEEHLRRVIAEARTMHSRGDPRGALALVETELIRHPTDPRLLHLRAALSEGLRQPAPPVATVPPPHPAVRRAPPFWRNPWVLAAAAAAAVILLILLGLHVFGNPGH